MTTTTNIGSRTTIFFVEIVVDMVAESVSTIAPSYQPLVYFQTLYTPWNPGLLDGKRSCGLSPYIKWEGGFASNAAQNVSSFFNMFSCIQVVTNFTRIKNPITGEGNLLDIFLVSPPNLFISCGIEEGIGDHKTIVLNIQNESNLRNMVL